MTRRPINPWADGMGAPPPPPTTREQPRVPSEYLDGGGEEINPHTGGIVATPVVDFRVPNYGGVRVIDAYTRTEAALKILDTLVTHLQKVEQELLSFDVLIDQMDAAPVSGFFVHRRNDGWTLSVPAAQTPEQAFLQITQALLAIERGPHRALLAQSGIRPYRQ